MLLMLLVIGVAAPALPLPEPSADEVQQNRQLLARWKSDAAHYARLKADLREFLALPPERQAQLRRLDLELHDEVSTTQSRYWRVLERYAHWLERLPDADRQDIEAAADSQERLARVKEIRDREWLSRLPRSRREQVEQAPEEQQAQLISQLREEERKRRRDWEKAVQAAELPQRRWQPQRLSDLPAEVRTFVETALMPMLSDQDKARLTGAEGKWPAFGKVLLDVVERHPLPALPGPAMGPVRAKDLPPHIRSAVTARPPELRQPDRQRLKNAEGRWPDYAIAVTEFMRSKRLPLGEELGPARPDKFPQGVQEFLEKQLIPALDDMDRERLQAAEGRWPDYPRAILELSRKHGLTLPGVTPPGPREFWDRLRLQLN
jgi:hypothetical protein